MVVREKWGWREKLATARARAEAREGAAPAGWAELRGQQASQVVAARPAAAARVASPLRQAQVALRARPEQQVRRALRVERALLARRVRQALRVRRALRVERALLARRVRQALRVRRALRVLLARRERGSMAGATPMTTVVAMRTAGPTLRSASRVATAQAASSV